MSSNLTKLAIVLAGAGLAMQAGTAQARVGYICPEYDRATQTLSVKVATGCITGMARLKGQDLQLIVDQDRALISVTGEINFHKIERQVVSADCNGRESFTLDGGVIEPRRYNVVYRNETLGALDLLGEAEATDCLKPSRASRGSSKDMVNPGTFNEWAFDEQGAWQEWRGGSVTALLKPILGNHVEAMEGKPGLTVSMKQARWYHWAFPKLPVGQKDFLGVEIERTGIADDAVSADRYFVAVVQSEDGWRVDKLWRQQMCARGKFAGQWTEQNCP